MKIKSRIPFNKPYMTGSELQYIEEAYQNGHLSGDGLFTEKCNQWLKCNLDVEHALLTPSCTAALEMAAILLDITPGDEVIMPSYTFVSTANAFVLRGAIPVFVDIRKDTLNIDENLIEAALTKQTKAIVVVHYAGVGCEMHSIMQIARSHNIVVIEDSAQALDAYYKGKPLGSFGEMSTLSFHETKNVQCGEGGAILFNSKSRVVRAEIIREKGTDRSQFFRKEVDKYTWQDLGSSFIPSELTAAFLYSQLENTTQITKIRLNLWERYYRELQDLEDMGKLRRPRIPSHCQHNAHIFYVLFNSAKIRNQVLSRLEHNGINAIFHYIPLHSSPGGLKYGKCGSKLDVTEQVAGNILRLPLWIGMSELEQNHVVDNIKNALSE